MKGKGIRNPWQLLYRIYRYVKPIVEREFSSWYEKAQTIPDQELRKQAMDSMSTKKFHCEGGAVYASQAIAHVEVLVPLIVAYQTISDYLDNLCDRSTSLDPVDFRQLHLSMQDALTPGAPIRDYYRYREEKEDGGFLAQLVKTCQNAVAKLPSYKTVQPLVLKYSLLYSDLQVHKHIAPEKREAELLAWWQEHRLHYPDILWQEFSAVTGSTIGIFALFVMATEPAIDDTDIVSLDAAYFPWVCGLHILLDYLIDLEEDKAGGDLNFVSYYSSSNETTDRLQYFVRRAKESVKNLPNAPFHGMIVDGLITFYLVDRKVNRYQPQIYNTAKQLLKQAGSITSFLFYVNSFLVRR